ncbi:MAG: uncharacterized protein A8A55_2908 [Amphiamblys sp. WSBS2006]|nr:MAG: uncharacterized protein A8A55_2908 [Amphiamblys sp. WSBS2006]
MKRTIKDHARETRERIQRLREGKTGSALARENVVPAQPQNSSQHSAAVRERIGTATGSTIDGDKKNNRSVREHAGTATIDDGKIDDGKKTSLAREFCVWKERERFGGWPAVRDGLDAFKRELSVSRRNFVLVQARSFPYINDDIVSFEGETVLSKSSQIQNRTNVFWIPIRSYKKKSYVILECPLRVDTGCFFCPNPVFLDR